MPIDSPTLRALILVLSAAPIGLSAGGVAGLRASGDRSPSCVECHLPGLGPGAVVAAPGRAGVPDNRLLAVGMWAASRLGVAAGRPEPVSFPSAMADGAMAERHAMAGHAMPASHTSSSGGDGAAPGSMPDGIVGSAHDFSGLTWNGTGAICTPCHVPHVENTSTAGITPLWNHDVSVANYTVYDSPTLTATPEQPRDVSVLCLGCHDGTVALDAFGGQSGNTMIQGNANIGTDLSAEHPISIQWTHKGVTSCDGCHYRHGEPFNSPLPFYEGRVECASCHDPHDQTPFNPLGQHFLRLPTIASELCMLCHHK